MAHNFKEDGFVDVVIRVYSCYDCHLRYETFEGTSVCRGGEPRTGRKLFLENRLRLTESCPLTK